MMKIAVIIFLMIFVALFFMGAIASKYKEEKAGFFMMGFIVSIIITIIGILW